MEEKVDYILKIIEEDGDSFASRAEMYYRKRPELTNFVEDSFRGYRALAERYDHLSRELQNANRTIATVFPEQVQLSMEDEDEENVATTPTPSFDPKTPSKDLPAAPKLSIPKIPQISRKKSKMPSRLMSKKGLLKMNVPPAAAATPASGLSKTEALEEIDKLQKRILAFQTEKEFVKSSYESGIAKFWDIEQQSTEMQAKVSSLQDEFGIGTVIEDDEARTLMATTALKSCQETLAELQEKQARSVEEARMEYRRIKETREKFETLKKQVNKNTNQQHISEEYESESRISELKNSDQQVDSIEEARNDLELLREKIKEQLEANSSSSFTMSEMAEKIDELVDTVITLETVVTSQSSLVKRIRAEANELQAHIQGLEEDKEALFEGSDSMSNEICELEQKLQIIQNLNQNVEDQDKNLQIHFTEASCNLDHVSNKLRNLKPDEEDQNLVLFSVPVDDPEKMFQVREDTMSPGNLSKISENVEKEEEEKEVVIAEQSTCIKVEEENFVQSDLSNQLLDLQQNGEVTAGYSMSSKEATTEEEEKKDVAGHEASVKDDEQTFALFNPSNQFDDSSREGPLRAAPDANPERMFNEDEEMAVPVYDSLISMDTKMEDKKNDGYPDHDPVEAYFVFEPSIQFQELPTDMKMEDEKNEGCLDHDPVEPYFVSEPSFQLRDLPEEVQVRDAPYNDLLIIEDLQMEEEEKKDDILDHSTCVEAKEKGHDIRSNASNLQDYLSGKDEESKKQDLLPAADNSLDMQPQELGTENTDELNWRELFLNGLENREKILLQEYTSILRNYKEIKKQLSEAEKKNQDSLFKSAMQIKELENDNALKDMEIQSLHEKLDSLQVNRDEPPDSSLTDPSPSQQAVPNESLMRGSSFAFDISYPSSDQKPVPDLLAEQNVESIERTEEPTAAENVKSFLPKVEEEEEKEEEERIISVDETNPVSAIEEKIRMDIDGLLEENIEFWLRFSTSFQQITKFESSVEDLQAELMPVRENKKQEGSSKHHHQSINSDARPIYKHLREIQSELGLWLQQNTVLEDDLENRLLSLSNIHEEISRLSKAGSKAEDAALSEYQAAKFQGEVLNMRQENNRVAEELQAGLEHVKRLQVEIQMTLSKLEEELGISESKHNHKNSSSRHKLPLRSFLFGVRLKKQKQKPPTPSIFTCMSPALQKQYSDLSALPPK
ncbi:protein NETWORKED 2B-like [Cornus florida]|uniref:protein NETWORKED 2B-like n=1 Tax=Cornus florida TaxID=4283 RepID=UPI0028A25098|nr:protein NETWORKED 2B-like [Cornus florida]